jgi:NADP-dependent 3-hydroxy acid dehydrogenase YdfG
MTCPGPHLAATVHGCNEKITVDPYFQRSIAPGPTMVAPYTPTKGSTMGDVGAETSGKTRRRHFITGAGSGIGAAVAAMLYARGDELWLLTQSDERADELWQRFPQAEILVADLANPPALEMTLLSAVLPRLLDCLLHIAGVIDFSLAAELAAGQIRELVNVNMMAPMILTRALLPALRRARGLVLIANSTATLSADAAGRSAYVASKSGLRGFADVLRREESSHGVRVTTVFPGRTDTPMQERVHEQEKRVYDAARLMRPDTVARSILHVVDLPADATIHDLTIRPTPHHEPAEPPCSGTCRVGNDSSTFISPPSLSLGGLGRLRTGRSR